MFPMMSNALCHQRQVQFQTVLQKKIEATLILKLTALIENSLEI